MNQSNLLRPDVAPSKNGGIVLIAADGARIHIPDDEVEAFVADCQHVRIKQLRSECIEIAALARSGVV